MNNRIKYLDVAKFIGIFCIYLGHFSHQAGNAYGFVFTFHVPLFFFLSGCTENLGADVPIDKYIIKNIKKLIIPCYLFAMVSLVVSTIIDNTHTAIVPNLIEILKGCIREHYLAYSLWFLTCLFVVKIIFYIFRTIFKFKWLNLFICIVLYCVSKLLISPRSPHMVYNIDSACYYIIYYAFGYYGFEFLHSLLDWKKPIKKSICIGVGIVLFIYTALLFFGKNLLTYINNNAVMHLICPVLTSIFVILLILIISKAIENIELFGLLGKDTLFLCGSEHLIKLLVPLCFQIVGLTVSLPNPITSYIYTLFLLVLCSKTLVPLEKAAFKKLHLIK